EILDLNFAARLLVATLDNGARRPTLVGVFQLGAEIVFWIAEIKFGANFRGAQRRHHALVVGNAIPVEYSHNHRARGRFFADLAEVGECGLKARNADGKSGRGHRLAPET